MNQSTGQKVATRVAPWWSCADCGSPFLPEDGPGLIVDRRIGQVRTLCGSCWAWVAKREPDRYVLQLEVSV
jgi:hypothetical protein